MQNNIRTIFILINDKQKLASTTTNIFQENDCRQKTFGIYRSDNTKRCGFVNVNMLWSEKVFSRKPKNFGILFKLLQNTASSRNDEQINININISAKLLLVKYQRTKKILTQFVEKFFSALPSSWNSLEFRGDVEKMMKFFAIHHRTRPSILTVPCHELQPINFIFSKC